MSHHTKVAGIITDSVCHTTQKWRALYDRMSARKKKKKKQKKKKNVGLPRQGCRADTQRCSNVASTSMQRHDVASTLMRRYINVMCLLGREPSEHGQFLWHRGVNIMFEQQGNIFVCSFFFFFFFFQFKGNTYKRS